MPCPLHNKEENLREALENSLGGVESLRFSSISIWCVWTEALENSLGGVERHSREREEHSRKHVKL